MAVYSSWHSRGWCLIKNNLATVSPVQIWMEQILEKEKRIYLHCAVLHFTLIVGSIDVIFIDFGILLSLLLWALAHHNDDHNEDQEDSGRRSHRQQWEVRIGTFLACACVVVGSFSCSCCNCSCFSFSCSLVVVLFDCTQNLSAQNLLFQPSSSFSSSSSSSSPSSPSLSSSPSSSPSPSSFFGWRRIWNRKEQAGRVSFFQNVGHTINWGFG